MKKNLLSVFFFLLTISTISYAQINSATSGNWSDGATWVGGVVPGDTAVFINDTHTVTIDAPGAFGGTVTVNAGGTLNITGGGGAKFTGNIVVNGTLLVNTTDSVIVGYSSTGDKKIDLTGAAGVATFTQGTVLINGKFNSSALNTTTVNGANIIIDAQGSTGYAFRQTTNSGTHPFTFTSGKITILNPAVSSNNAELAMSSNVAPDISGTAMFVLGQGASTVSRVGGYRISLNLAGYLNHLTINTGNVDVTLLSNVTVKGDLKITSSGALGGGFFWHAPNYIFDGDVAQVTGTIMPDTVKNVTIDNVLGVTSSQDLAIKDTLFLISGTLSGPYTAGTTILVTGIEQLGEIPQSFALLQNYPNPFNPETKIRFEIPVTSFVNISVFNLLGEKVATLVNENLGQGVYEKSFGASNLTSGVYIYKLTAGSYTMTKKMMLMK